MKGGRGWLTKSTKISNILLEKYEDSKTKFQISSFRGTISQTSSHVSVWVTLLEYWGPGQISCYSQQLESFFTSSIVIQRLQIFGTFSYKGKTNVLVSWIFLKCLLWFNLLKYQSVGPVSSLNTGVFAAAGAVPIDEDFCFIWMKFDDLRLQKDYCILQ